LWQLGAALGAAALGAAVFRVSQGIVTARVETAADAATQAAMWDRLLELELSFFRDYPAGDLQSRLSAVGEMRRLLVGTTLRSVFAVFVVVLDLALLLYYSPRLTVVALGVALLAAAASVAAGGAQVRLARRVHELRGRFFGFMVQLVHGIAKLRVSAAEARAFALWARQYAELLRLEVRQRRIGDVHKVVTIAITASSTIALFAVAAPLVRPAGGALPLLSAGAFIAFSVAYGTFIAAITTLSETAADLVSARILHERARPLLEAPREVDAHKADPGQLAGRIRLDRVSFAYRSDGPPVLDGVDLTVEPGSFVALVGPSGSGKSTLFRLLLGFDRPGSGKILYDGQDLAGLDVHAVRRQMGVVLQYGRINAGSLFENIACATRVSLRDAWDAARAASFAEDIEAMPMGMHTVISEGGTNLSGGQRQRLLIARALVHRPRILLLDEATSALDNRTQATVSESLSRLSVTRIVIAHRLSTIREADRIFVIDAGRLVQAGRFAELAAQEGLFARLISRQTA
jgi:NHLM bacteriocin system ABC transporter ATP-binding protein